MQKYGLLEENQAWDIKVLTVLVSVFQLIGQKEKPIFRITIDL